MRFSSLILLLVAQSSSGGDPYPARLELGLGMTGRITICAPATIRRITLTTTRKIIHSMLQQADEGVTERLGRSNLVVVVAPRMRRFTDLPDLQPLANKRNAYGRQLNRVRAVFLPPDPPERLQPIVAVGEEDVLRIAPAGPRSQLRHELAHAVYFLGLNETQRGLWAELYRAARQDGLFAKRYASTNAEEFFAELTLAYFDAAPYFCSREQLRRIAPAAFWFLDRVYDPAREGPPQPWTPRPPVDPDHGLKKLSLRFHSSRIGTAA